MYSVNKSKNISQMKINYKEMASKFAAFMAGEQKEDKKDDAKKDDKVEFVEAVVKETGVTVAADTFEVGSELFLKTDEGDFVLAPEGVYELEDGTVITVDVEGKISLIEGVATDEDEMKKDEEKSEMKKDEAKAEYVTKADFDERFNALVTLLNETFSKLGESEAKAKTEMSADDIAKLKAFKLSLETKRKKIGDSKSKDVDVLEGVEKSYEMGYANPTARRTDENFKDFNF